MSKIQEKYGEMVFNKEVMKQRLAPSTYEKFITILNHGSPMDESIAEDIARAMKDWALENGATHFTHWFQPQRSGTAEKHDAFLSYDNTGGIIEKFSANQLIQSEPDASSFPSGGIRSTFEARGYTAWDPHSPAFLRESRNGCSLVIPSIYMSWTGEALDMKTPLLRSINTLNNVAIKLQRLLGNRHAKRIIVYSGMEQEYFLIPKPLYLKRPDLMITGRTLFGASPIKGQRMEDHYFGSIEPKVMEFMNDLEQELYRYGIPIKTKHNEVAPNQFELAPLYEEVNLAIDHNLQIMDIMRRIADNHGLAVLHHEKPFAGLNGSGKHMNWSIGDNTGSNYLEPSKSPLKNISFLMTLGALFIGMKHYDGLLRASIADASNEHRLGSHEAPPAILSIYLGDYLTEILDHIAGIKTMSEKEMNFITHGLQNMPKVVKDISDRNRTSPIAFTGNKFEFRAVGASANGSDAATAMNLVFAYGYQAIVDKLEKMDGDIKENCILVLKDILKTTQSVRFEGNNYSDDWRKEAKKRGLFISEHTAEAIRFYLKKDCQTLFETYNVLSKRELESRIEIKFDAYSNTKMVEIHTAIDMVNTLFLAFIRNQISAIGTTLSTVHTVKADDSVLKQEIEQLNTLYSQIKSETSALQALAKQADELHSYEKAAFLATKGTAQLNALRNLVDQAERLVAQDIWTLPRYDQLMSTLS